MTHFSQLSVPPKCPIARQRHKCARRPMIFASSLQGRLVNDKTLERCENPAAMSAYRRPRLYVLGAVHTASACSRLASVGEFLSVRLGCHIGHQRPWARTRRVGWRPAPIAETVANRQDYNLRARANESV